MTPQEFCYWLQGRAELLPDQPPAEAEWKMIREHLALVFKKVTPPKDAPNDAELLKKLQGEDHKARRRFGSPHPYDPFHPYRDKAAPNWPHGLEVTC